MSKLKNEEDIQLVFNILYDIREQNKKILSTINELKKKIDKFIEENKEKNISATFRSILKDELGGKELLKSITNTMKEASSESRLLMKNVDEDINALKEEFKEKTTNLL